MEKETSQGTDDLTFFQMRVNKFLAVQKNMVSIIRIIEILFDRYCSSNRQVDGSFLKSSLL